MARSATFFHSAEWYDLSVNWSARLGREVPVLRAVLGPPAAGGVLDAGCGTGRQTAELARLGYRMTGLDADADMLSRAAQLARSRGVSVAWVPGTYNELPERAPGPFDGAYCIGNALAACADARLARQAVRNFGAVLRPGGRLFIQILNFPLMRKESPCVRGPRVVVHGGVEYVSVRVFRVVADVAEITNVTLYKDDPWRYHADNGRLCPIAPEELRVWCTEAGLRIDHCWGGYDRTPFNVETSVDFILVATRTD